MGKSRQWSDEVAKMSSEERLDDAQRRINEVQIDLQAVIFQHECNQLVCFSTHLSDQIKGNEAALAFNMFRDNMMRGEILPLCAMWDAAAENRNSIPSITMLLDDRHVLDLLVAKAVKNANQHLPPKLTGWALDISLRHTEKVVSERRSDVEQAIQQSDAVRRSEEQVALKKFRDANIAHALDKETKQNVPDVNYQALTDILSRTEPIVQSLWLGLAYTSRNWDQVHSMGKVAAEALWRNCSFVEGQ
ncbi:hypothetical protein U0C82_08660 [Fulvimarina sp. 2208YS6-2-32]|uniref:HEPN AbiU2-like domain-containing protein n=1 Tax=Fulvimarina uroteuthidis TaxID=3098149 RepID=A0ABU5I1G1_9HYPH|nr:hypothetical protein [Fulvimarina sp. 2208YS6-2-32]MDY8109214.1 hypothetical protein [Fulvimarina sp. 2208YS6-2-32]